MMAKGNGKKNEELVEAAVSLAAAAAARTDGRKRKDARIDGDMTGRVEAQKMSNSNILRIPLLRSCRMR